MGTWKTSLCMWSCYCCWLYSHSNPLKPCPYSVLTLRGKSKHVLTFGLNINSEWWEIFESINRRCDRQPISIDRNLIQNECSSWNLDLYHGHDCLLWWDCDLDESIQWIGQQIRGCTRPYMAWMMFRRECP